MVPPLLILILLRLVVVVLQLIKLIKLVIQQLHPVYFLGSCICYLLELIICRSESQLFRWSGLLGFKELLLGVGIVIVLAHRFFITY